LPPALIEKLDLPWRKRGRLIMADGGDALFDIYEATIAWDGRPRRIAVDAVDVDPLVGMALLDGHVLTVEVVKDGKVRINALK
jgi:predicted aspartyl protease